MLRDAFLLAFRALRRNVLRSALTILGIVIGVAAVIVMVTLGSGTTAQVAESISSLGSNLLMVMPGQQQRGPGPGGGAAQPFRLGDVTAIARDVAAASAVAPIANHSATAVYGNENWSTSVTGTHADWFTIQHWTFAAGRAFTTSEQRSGTAVCVLGATVRERLFGAADPLGHAVRLDNVACQVIGVLAEKGQSAMGSDQDDVVVMPLRTVQRRLTGSQDIRQIQVAVRQGTSIERAQREIAAVLRERRHVGAGEEDDFRVNDMSQIGEMLTGTTELLTALLSAVAAVSLLVGGIGIMNIMLVSVTERTREIGVRLAVGAMARDVLTQFLVESVVLSSLGGLIGIGVALTASYILASVLGIPFVTNPIIIAVALLFSGAVGMIFGYFPARKAARLDPIEALRRE
jgi:putative ABC transport system permease protein